MTTDDKKQNMLISSEEKKDVLIEMLRNFGDFLDQNSINWHVAYGTMIGAVRHHGFIPWDDDIDICVPRGDYIKLLHLIDNKLDELKKKHLVRITYSAGVPTGHYYLWFKIADDRTYLRDNGCLRPGVHIDVFPIDKISNSSGKEYRKCKNKILRYCNLCDLSSNEREIKVTSIGKTLIYKALNKAFSIIGRKRITEFFERKLINAELSASNGYYFYAGSRFNDCVEVEKYERKILVPFESLKVPIPDGFDTILKVQYGHYMELPPKDKRHGHEYEIIYWI